MMLAEINPVLLKELQQRFRSGKTSWLLALYLLAIGAFVLGFMYLNWHRFPGFFQPSRSRELFMLLSAAQLFLLAFVTPGLTAGVISGERERQTLNVLLITRLTAWQIIWSKLASSSAFVVLLVITTFTSLQHSFPLWGHSSGAGAGNVRFLPGHHVFFELYRSGLLHFFQKNGCQYSRLLQPGFCPVGRYRFSGCIYA